MSFKVQVGPPQISIHQGQTVLVSEPDGQITWPSDKGLYFLDTRVISSWSLFANGEPWDLLNGGAITYYGARIFQTNRAFLPRADRSRRASSASRSAATSAAACTRTSTSPTTAARRLTFI